MGMVLFGCASQDYYFDVSGLQDWQKDFFSQAQDYWGMSKSKKNDLENNFLIDEIDNSGKTKQNKAYFGTPDEGKLASAYPIKQYLEIEYIGK